MKKAGLPADCQSLLLILLDPVLDVNLVQLDE